MPASGTRPSEAPPRVQCRETRKILFVNQYYWPDRASTAQHLCDLAESLAAEGHEVHVLCGRGSSKPGDEAPRPRAEERNGVKIHRVGATSLGRSSSWKRMTDYLSFFGNALWCAGRLPRFDLVVTLTTPPLIGLLGVLLKRLKGSTHVSWCMDLHPDASLALGRMNARNPVVRFLAWLGDETCRRADRVVVLGPYMSDRVLSKQAKPARVVTLPVWSRADEIYPLPRAGHPLRESLGLGDKFVAMYSGNLGLSHRFEEFLEAARELRYRQDVVFLFVGGGPRLNEVRELVSRDQLSNVRFLDSVPREQLHALLSLADAHLISMRTEMVGIVVPSKLYGAMASARPSLFVGPAHCEPADLIREVGCGLTFREGDSAGLVQAIERLAGDPDLAHQMGQVGREAFLAEHEREACCVAWSELVTDLLASSTEHEAPLPALREDALLRHAPLAANRVRVPGRRPSPAARTPVA